MRRFVRSASLLVLCLVGCGEHPGVLSPDRGKAPSPDSQLRSAYVAVNDSSSVGRAKVISHWLEYFTGPGTVMGSSFMEYFGNHAKDEVKVTVSRNGSTSGSNSGFREKTYYLPGVGAIGSETVVPMYGDCGNEVYGNAQHTAVVDFITEGGVRSYSFDTDQDYKQQGQPACGSDDYGCTVGDNNSLTPGGDDAFGEPLPDPNGCNGTGSGDGGSSPADPPPPPPYYDPGTDPGSGGTSGDDPCDTQVEFAGCPGSDQQLALRALTPEIQWVSFEPSAATSGERTKAARRQYALVLVDRWPEKGVLAKAGRFVHGNSVVDAVFLPREGLTAWHWILGVRALSIIRGASTAGIADKNQTLTVYQSGARVLKVDGAAGRTYRLPSWRDELELYDRARVARLHQTFARRLLPALLKAPKRSGRRMGTQRLLVWPERAVGARPRPAASDATDTVARQLRLAMIDRSMIDGSLRAND